MSRVRETKLGRMVDDALRRRKRDGAAGPRSVPALAVLLGVSVSGIYKLLQGERGGRQRGHRPDRPLGISIPLDRWTAALPEVDPRDLADALGVDTPGDDVDFSCAGSGT